MFDYLHSNVFVYIVLATILSISISSFFNKKTYFEQNKEIIYKRNSYVLSLILLAFMIICYWIVFMPLSIGHKDEIAYFGEYIPPQIWNGRFFPLGHQEFNLLVDFFGYEKYYLYYILPFIQIILFIILVDKIVGLINSYIRIFIIISTFYLSGIVPITNLIIPERNQIIFFLLGIYLIKKYYLTGKNIFAYISIFVLSLSMYYKEPTFTSVGIFIFILLVYKYLNFKTIYKKTMNIKQFLLSFDKLEIGLIIATLFFIFGYLFYTYYNGAPIQYYGKVNSSDSSIFFNKIVYFIKENPVIISLLLIITGSHFFINNDFYKRYTVSIASSGLIYLLAMAVLGLPLNGYYYSIPLLCLSLSFGLLLKNILLYKNNINLRLKIFITILFIMYAIVNYKMYIPIKNDILNKKNLQSMYFYLEKELIANKDIKNLYYILPKNTTYGDYQTAVLMSFIHKKDIDHNFRIYSESGCAPWNENYNNGLIKCIKKDFKIDEISYYDLVVIENNDLFLDKTTKYNISEFNSKFSKYQLSIVKIK